MATGEMTSERGTRQRATASQPHHRHKKTGRQARLLMLVTLSAVKSAASPRRCNRCPETR